MTEKRFDRADRRHARPRAPRRDGRIALRGGNVMTFIIRDGNLNQWRNCPLCKKFLQEHPSLRRPNVLKQKRKKDGTWYHTSQNGRMLHFYALKKSQEAT